VLNLNQKIYYASSLNMLKKMFFICARAAAVHVNMHEAKYSLLIVWQLLYCLLL